MQWAGAFFDRTGVVDSLKRGMHHVTIDLFDTKMNAEGLQIAAAYQKFLVETCGLYAKANLIGMSWGGWFSIRYTANYPENVKRIYLDAPLLNFDHFSWTAKNGVPAEWGFGSEPEGGWGSSPEMPVNLASKVAAAKVAILLAYGGQDQTVPPEYNCEKFVPVFKAAGGEIEVVKRGGFGHHPHGFEQNEAHRINDFFLK